MSCVTVTQGGQLSAAKRKKKFTGGNASKRHRDRVNVEFNNLAKLLPYPEAMISKLDKSSILRLAVSYIRAKSFFKDNVSSESEDSRDDTPDAKKAKIDIPIANDINVDPSNSMAEIFLQALEGFLLVITEDLKVLYVSESVRDYLGYCQAGIIHESILNFVHGSDEGIIHHALQFLDSKTNKSKQRDSDREEESSVASSNDSNSISSVEDNEDSSLVQSRKFICRMKCAFSCSSRFFTAFNSFQFSGHLRKSFVQEGKTKKSLNTLIVFCSPMADTENGPRAQLIDRSLSHSNGYDDKSHSSASDEESNDGQRPKMSGLPIEPKFRLHVAPIVMSARDLENCAISKARTSSSSSSIKSKRHSIGSHGKSNAKDHVDDSMQTNRMPVIKSWCTVGSVPSSETTLNMRYPYHRVPRTLSNEDLYRSTHRDRLSPHHVVRHNTSNNKMGEFAPEVFSSAKILLDLSQHCAARREYGTSTNQHSYPVSTSSPSSRERWSDDESNRYQPSYPRHSQPSSVDDAVLETHGRVYHIPRRERAHQFPYANDTKEVGSCCAKCDIDAKRQPNNCHRRPEPVPISSSIGSKRGFNISSILGLEDNNRKGSHSHGMAPQDYRCPNGQILHFPKRKIESECKESKEEKSGSMDDMKSSFANILQGMASNIADRFNTAITKAIENTADHTSNSP